MTTCNLCGGLIPTEKIEMLAGTVCKCGGTYSVEGGVKNPKKEFLDGPNPVHYGSSLNSPPVADSLTSELDEIKGRIMPDTRFYAARSPERDAVRLLEIVDELQRELDLATKRNIVRDHAASDLLASAQEENKKLREALEKIHTDMHKLDRAEIAGITGSALSMPKDNK